MKMRNLINMIAGVCAAAVLLTSNAVFAEATLPEVYQAVQSVPAHEADHAGEDPRQPGVSA